MHVLDLFNEADRSFLSIPEEKKEATNSETSDQDSGKKELYLDPELQRTMAFAQSHYPSYKDPQLAFDKWVQRSISHSVDTDQDQDDEINRLKRRYEELSKKLDQLKSMRVSTPTTPAISEEAHNKKQFSERFKKKDKPKVSKKIKENNSPAIYKKSVITASGDKKTHYQVTDIDGNHTVFETKLQAIKYFKENVEPQIQANPTDRVTMDVPLLLRVMEFAKEDAKTDMDLHDVAENLIELSSSGQSLSMKDYENIVNIPTRQEQTSDKQVNEVGDRYWCKDDKRWKDRK